MKRRKHSASFKSQVALVGIRGEQTVAEIASKYNVHPGQVQAWKAAALEKFPSLFEQGARSSDTSEEQIAVLERKVGQLSIENDFLKKSWQVSVRRRGSK